MLQWSSDAQIFHIYDDPTYYKITSWLTKWAWLFAACVFIFIAIAFVFRMMYATMLSKDLIWVLSANMTAECPMWLYVVANLVPATQGMINFLAFTLNPAWDDLPKCPNDGKRASARINEYLTLKGSSIASTHLDLEDSLEQAATSQRSYESFSIKSIHAFAREQIKLNFGDSGAGLVLSGLQVKYFNPQTRMGILKVPRDHCQMVSAALALATQVSKRPCNIRVRHVSGTIKKCQRAAIRTDRELIVTWHLKQQSLARAGAATVTGDHVLQTMLKESESQISALEI
ncbi:RNA-binding protein pop5 [Coemansia sp. RSA 2050]|nr:RNA-binding protein pop5 [Coemansia sp. RSA 2050]